MKRPQEVADFLGKPITMSRNGDWHWYSNESIMTGFATWYPHPLDVNNIFRHGLIPDTVEIEYEGDWRDSLILPKKEII